MNNFLADADPVCMLRRDAAVCLCAAALRSAGRMAGLVCIVAAGSGFAEGGAASSGRSIPDVSPCHEDTTTSAGELFGDSEMTRTGLPSGDKACAAGRGSLMDVCVAFSAQAPNINALAGTDMADSAATTAAQAQMRFMFALPMEEVLWVNELRLLVSKRLQQLAGADTLEARLGSNRVPSGTSPQSLPA